MAQLGQFVDDPDEKWISEYHMMFDQFEMQFPTEDPLFKKFEAIQDGKISDDFIEELRRSKESSLLAKDTFENHKLPISFLINTLNKGPFETWAPVINERDMHIWVVSGNLEELLRGASVAKHSTKVLCDITTLLTIRHLGLLDILKDRYKLYIHQDQFDLAFQEYSRTKLISNDGLKTITYEDGKVIMNEFSSEQVQKTVKNLEDLIIWINDNCTKVGNVISHDHKDREDRVAFLNNPIKVSKHHAYTMLVDSMTIVGYSKDSYEVNCFTSLDLLNILLSDGVIVKEKHSESIGILMMIGYSLIPVNKDVFIYYLKKNNYKINNEIALVFDNLKQKEFNEDFIIDVLSDLLGWLWIADISMYERQQITDYLCVVLTTHRKKSNVISKLIRHSKTKFSVLVQHHWEKMKSCIEQWLEIQSIV